jgi:flagellar basal-body rod protein FlgG
MSGAIYQAASGAIVQELRLQVISNNLANLNTAGYKADRPRFRIPGQEETRVEEDRTDQLPRAYTMQEGSEATEDPPATIPFGQFVDFSQGATKVTGNPLDFAINGSGFFVIETESGNAYTRDGSFTISEDGTLVTHEGRTVLGEGGQITIDGEDVAVDLNGNILVDGEEVATLKIVEFPKPYPLEKTMDNLFTPISSAIIGEEAENYTIAQGALESSNVNPIQSMTEMVETHRVFEFYQKVIQTLSQADDKAINEVGKL